MFLAGYDPSMDRAVVREVSATFDRAVISDRGRPPDVALAREQHAAYRGHLERAGYEVTTIPADDRYPDCVFVEDTAVVIGGTALLTRPGTDSRVGEVHAVANQLASLLPVAHISPPGTLDGGDVMQIGTHLWVGYSSRSNREGLDQLTRVAAEEGVVVTVVPVTGVLHLKSAVLPIGPATVVVTPGTVDESLLAGLEVLHEDESEHHKFSALPLRDGRVLVTDAAPRTGELLSSRGIQIEPLDISEILAVDGGLTCMSILFTT